jgi:hypothetical protein
VHGWKKLVQVAEVVLTELSSCIAERFKHGGKRDGLIRNANVCTSLTYGGQSGTYRQLAGNEVGATRRATCLGVVVGEHHALRSQLVEVGRLSGHHSAVVGANVEPANIVAHDDNDVRFTLLLRYRGRAHHQRGGEKRQQTEP